MKICVVGCGAVGSLFAANLATLEDVEVFAYDVNQAHVDAINAQGLRLTGAGDVVGRPIATSDASALPKCDFGIVATKALHTGAALEATARVFERGAVATVQNGIGNEEVIAEHVERVVRGTTFPAGKIERPERRVASNVEPGVVQWDVEPRPAERSEIERLADACSRAGMPYRGCRRCPRAQAAGFGGTSGAAGDA